MKNEQNQTILAGKVPVGYKQTEVGIIPEDWELKSIGELAKVYRGASPRPIDDPKWFDRNSSIGWLRISDVSNAKKYLFNTSQSLSNLGVLKSRFVPAGNLVMSICATVGKPIITKKDLCIHDGFVVFNSLVPNQEYMYYSLEKLEGSWSKKGQTGSQMNLNTTLINNVIIPIPPLKEQIAIAEALSDVDSLLVSLEKLIEKKRAIKTGTMQQLLTGKKRLPTFAQREDGTPKGYKTTELGEIPEDWEVVSFDSILEKFQNGYAFSASKYAATGIPIITMSQIGLSGKFQFDLHNVNYWDFASSSDLKDFEVHYGDLLIAMTDVTPDKNLIGQMAISSYNDTALLNQRVGIIRCNPDLIQKQFLFYLSSMPIWKQYCKNVASLGVQANIGVKDIKRAKIVLPSLKEQTAIAEILSDMDAEIEALEAKRTKTEEIKQGMMQELLTGRTRLI